MLTRGCGHAALVVLSVLCLGLLEPPAVGAGEPTDQLRAQVERVIRTAQDPDVKKSGRVAERRAVRKIAEQIFDYAETAKRALARHWTPRSPGEREEFVALFADLFEHAYISKIELYQGERITFLAETIEGDQATVQTQMQLRQGSELDVDYRMRRDAAGRWLVYDVVIESVSLIDNYRSQFNSIIQRSSYQELVRRLKALQLKLQSEGSPRPDRS